MPTELKKVIQELNAEIGAELALQLIRNSENRGRLITGACTFFAPCCFLPIVIYTKTASSEKEIAKEDKKIVNLIKSQLKALIVKQSDVIDPDTKALLPQSALISILAKRAQATNSIINLFNNLQSKAYKMFLENIPDQFETGMAAYRNRLKTEAELNDIKRPSISLN